MPKKSRWKSHTEQSLGVLAQVFSALSTMAGDLAKDMHDRHIDHVTVEHWQGTKTGIGHAEQMLLDIREKMSDKPKAMIAGLLEKVEAGCVTPKVRRRAKRVDKNGAEAKETPQ
jgi:hypothetical protein